MILLFNKLTEKLAPSGKTTNLFFLDNSPDESAPSEASTSVVAFVPKSVPFAANACDKHWPIDAKTITNHRVHLSWSCCCKISEQPLKLCSITNFQPTIEHHFGMYQLLFPARKSWPCTQNYKCY